MKPKLRLIGDVHGKYDQYLKLLDGATFTIQIGDMGFSYDHLRDIPDRHRFFGGNHDNYGAIKQCLNNLGDFGVVPYFGQVFWVRGGWSIDRKYRLLYRDWWPDEELTESQCDAAFTEYCRATPDVLVSHECPISIVKYVTNPEFVMDMGFAGFQSGVIPTRTNQLLQRMIEAHKPKLHVFGHYHKAFDEVVDGVRYVCLPELGTLDLPAEFVLDL